MAATLTITLSPEILKALTAEKNIAIAVASGGSPPHGSRPAPAAKAKATDGKAGPYRAGSLPAKLLSWAGGRKKPFGVSEVMKKFRVKRSHASMLLSYVLKGEAVKRVGRGEYRVAQSAPAAG